MIFRQVFLILSFLAMGGMASGSTSQRPEEEAPAITKSVEDWGREWCQRSRLDNYNDYIQSIAKIPEDKRPLIGAALKFYIDQDDSYYFATYYIRILWRLHQQGVGLGDVRDQILSLDPNIRKECMREVLDCLTKIPSNSISEFFRHLKALKPTKVENYSPKYQGEVLAEIPPKNWSEVVALTLPINDQFNELHGSWVLRAVWNAYQQGYGPQFVDQVRRYLGVSNSSHGVAVYQLRKLPFKYQLKALQHLEFLKYHRSILLIWQYFVEIPESYWDKALEFIHQLSPEDLKKASSYFLAFNFASKNENSFDPFISLVPQLMNVFTDSDHRSSAVINFSLCKDPQSALEMVIRLKGFLLSEGALDTFIEKTHYWLQDTYGQFGSLIRPSMTESLLKEIIRGIPGLERDNNVIYPWILAAVRAVGDITDPHQIVDIAYPILRGDHRALHERRIVDLENVETSTRRSLTKASLQVLYAHPAAQRMNMDQAVAGVKSYIGELQKNPYHPFHRNDRTGHSEFQNMLSSLEGPYKGYESILQNEAYGTLDDGIQPRILGIFTRVWQVIGAWEDPQVQENLKYSFLKALSEIIDEKMDGMRVCPNGKAQRLVTVLQGYVPGIVIDSDGTQGQQEAINHGQRILVQLSASLRLAVERGAGDQDLQTHVQEALATVRSEFKENPHLNLMIQEIQSGVDRVLEVLKH